MFEPREKKLRGNIRRIDERSKENSVGQISWNRLGAKSVKKWAKWEFRTFSALFTGEADSVSALAFADE